VVSSDLAAYSPRDIVGGRNALWSNDHLRTEFVESNPASLSSVDLDVISGWGSRKAGEFYIWSYLKKHAVLLSATDPVRVYGIVGLGSSIAEVAGPDIPLLAELVLLPFEGQIVYDGFVETIAILGSGMRLMLQDHYDRALERDGVITDLAPRERGPREEAALLRERNKAMLAAFRRHINRGAINPETVVGHVAVLRRLGTWLLSRQTPLSLLDLDPDQLSDFALQACHPKDRVSLRRFVRFLDQTWRIDRAAAQRFLEALK
jgi:hypothetical protein